MMASADEEKTFPCSSIEDFPGEDIKSRNHKNRDMVLNVGAKPDTFMADQTPTPIKLIQKCEEMGLFQDLRDMNPFEETFRQATEDIRSGTAPLEMSSLSVPNNIDDSLHTPHVIFPTANDLNRSKGTILPREDLSIPIIQTPDPLCLSLDSDEPEKSVVQQEADTSEDTQIPNLNAPSSEEEASFGTIQFLLRMPNGKIVQLSSLPVEQMDAAPQASKDKDIPIINIDSSFLKTIDERGRQDSYTSTASAPVSNWTTASNSSSNSVLNVSDSSYGSGSQTASMRLSDGRESSEQASKMSLAKQKLKQALMSNSRPAVNPGSSGIISSCGLSSSVVKLNSSQSEHIEVRRGSSVSSDDGLKPDDSNHDLSSVEEKRRRNRAAAMRCREKRKTWVKELERRANDMLSTNNKLQYEVTMLRDEVAQLKTLLLAHRDCPVTQAMVQGKASLPLDTSTSSTKQLSSKGLKSPPSTMMLQTPASGNPLKPLILLNDPPAKRKRLNSSATSVSVVSSSHSSSPSVHTLVIPSKNATVLNPSFVNVIPSVLVANPTTSTSNPIGGHSQVIYSQLLPCLPTLNPKQSVNVVTSKQAYILPKAKINPVPVGKMSYIRQSKSDGKFHATQLLSTNVIKVNPNVVDRDSNDSDIEILDVK